LPACSYLAAAGAATLQVIMHQWRRSSERETERKKESKRERKEVGDQPMITVKFCQVSMHGPIM
jgi:hypothetical protein